MSRGPERGAPPGRSPSCGRARRWGSSWALPRGARGARTFSRATLFWPFFFEPGLEWNLGPAPIRSGAYRGPRFGVKRCEWSYSASWVASLFSARDCFADVASDACGRGQTLALPESGLRSRAEARTGLVAQVRDGQVCWLDRRGLPVSATPALVYLECTRSGHRTQNIAKMAVTRSARQYHFGTSVSEHCPRLWPLGDFFLFCGVLGASIFVFLFVGLFQVTALRNALGSRTIVVNGGTESQQI